MNVAATRAALVARDGDSCVYCGKSGAETNEGVLTVDHKTPLKRGGVEEIENYQLLCGACNTEKGSRTDEEAQQLVRFSSSIAKAGFTVAHNVVLFDTRLSTSARLLYFQLRHYGYMSQYISFGSPEQTELAANLGIKERALRPYIAELVEFSLVKVRRRGRGKSNVYIICEPTCGKHTGGNQDRQNNAALDRQKNAGLFKDFKRQEVKDKKDLAHTRTEDSVQNAGTRENLRPPNDQNSIFRVVTMINNGSITDDLTLQAELAALRITGAAADALRDNLNTHREEL